MVVPNMDGPTRDQVLKLMEEKDKIEAEIAQLGEVLKTNGNVGLTESLVDENGFPRNDIDVYAVRHARHRIICLQNDHKAIMKQIERGIHTVFASQTGAATDNVMDTSGPLTAHSSANGTAGSSSQTAASSSGPVPLTNGYGPPHGVGNVTAGITEMHVTDPAFIRPIAKVNFVNPGSPAEDAGIKVDDQILSFGSVNSSNFKELSQIGEVVQHSANSRVEVSLLRDRQTLRVSLMPRPWAGRGLLGCNILPMDSA